MVILNNIQEDLMPTFMMSLNWTDQGIRAVKDSPKRSEDARELAKKVGVEIKHLYLTSGDTDLVIFVDAPSGDNVAKFALRERFSRDKTVFQTAWLYGYDVGRELR